MRPTPAKIDTDPAIEIKLLGWLVVALTIVGFMAAAGVQNNSRQRETAEWANHTHAFISETDAILSSLHAAEAAQAAYFLTGDEATRKVATDQFAAVDNHLNAATHLAFEDPDQLDRLGAISALVQKRISLNKEAARLMPAQATKLFTTTDARADLLNLEADVASSRARENRLLLQRDQSLQRHRRRTLQIQYAGGGLTLILLGLAYYAVRTDLKARRNAAAMLEEKIREGAAELQATSEKLHIEHIEQKWGHAALQRTIGHHELVLNSIQEGVFVVSKDGHIISANPAAANLTRREARQLAGKSIGSVLLNNDRLPFPWERHFLRSPLKNGRTLATSPATVKQADGSLIDVQIACHPTRDRENLTGAIITVAAPNHSPMQ
jgi:PAS domain S-box-containing protein